MHLLFSEVAISSSMFSSEHITLTIESSMMPVETQYIASRKAKCCKRNPLHACEPYVASGKAEHVQQKYIIVTMRTIMDGKLATD
jgi:hypothetical protein